MYEFFLELMTFLIYLVNMISLFIVSVWISAKNDKRAFPINNLNKMIWWALGFLWFVAVGIVPAALNI